MCLNLICCIQVLVSRAVGKSKRYDNGKSERVRFGSKKNKRCTLTQNTSDYVMNYLDCCRLWKLIIFLVLMLNIDKKTKNKKTDQ